MERLTELVNSSNVRRAYTEGLFGGNRWPNDTMPYCINETPPNAVPSSALVRSAIDHWAGNTKLKFSDVGKFCHAPIAQDVIIIHIHFQGGTDCHSAVGCQNGIQDIVLNANCADFGGIVHEIGHAVGLYHEHSRPDRDQYVTILWENIIDAQKPNFDIVNANMDESIMHYDSLAFSENGASGALSSAAWTS